MTEFEHAVESARLKRLRTVVRIVAEPQTATIRITLGCGHETAIRVAEFPLISIEDIYGIDLGDEMDCPHCESATKH